VFFADVSNYNLLRGTEDPAQSPNPNYDEEHYINALAPLLTKNNYPAHFIVDREHPIHTDVFLDIVLPIRKPLRRLWIAHRRRRLVRAMQGMNLPRLTLLNHRCNVKGNFSV
jgi:Glycosyl hydrolases family 6